MRADRHYVEQFGADVGQPVRLLPLHTVECAPAGPAEELRPLIESIRTHGIVHPLLVRRQQGERYEVIAGRKRFAAAHILRLPTIPCIVRDASPPDVAALAAADNLSVRSESTHDHRDFAAVRRLASEHLHRVVRAADLSIGQQSAALDRSSVDVMKAHATRAAYLLEAVERLERPTVHDVERPCAIAPVVEEVVASFAAEAQLRRVQLRIEMDGYYTVAVDRRDLTIALAGALLATLGVVGEAPHAAIVMRVFHRAPRRASLEIATDRPATLAILDDWSRPDSVFQNVDCSAAIGARTARVITECCGGTIEWIASAGTRVVMTFPGPEHTPTTRPSVS